MASWSPKGAPCRRALGFHALVALVIATTLGCGCSGPAGSSEGQGEAERVSVRVLFAGSLIIPFAQVEEEFEAAHPEIDLNMEGHGSIQAVRIVGDLHEQADLVVTADHRLIQMLLYESHDPESGFPYASWSVIFATNDMALAYTSESAYSDEVNAENWYEIVNRPGVRLGCSDPRLDANGYRALMTVRLAEDYYGRPGLFKETFGREFRIPVRLSEADEGAVITVPELLETVSGSHLVLRPYSVSLLPLLVSGDIDYAFEYESVIRQHGLEYVTLPPAIGLGDPSHADYFGSVTVKLDFQRFASVEPVFVGEPIRYGVNIPSNAREPEAAALLLAFLLGPDGQRIMAENHQPVIAPALTDDLGALPEIVRPYCVSGE